MSLFSKSIISYRKIIMKDSLFLLYLVLFCLLFTEFYMPRSSCIIELSSTIWTFDSCLILYLLDHCCLLWINLDIPILFQNCSESQRLSLPLWNLLIFLLYLNLFLNCLTFFHQFLLLSINNSFLLGIKLFSLFLEHFIAIGFMLFNTIRIKFSPTYSTWP